MEYDAIDRVGACEERGGARSGALKGADGGKFCPNHAKPEAHGQGGMAVWWSRGR